MPISVVCVDNAPVIHDGLRRNLDEQPDFQVVADCRVPPDLRPLLTQHQPDVLVLGPPEHPRSLTAGFNLLATIQLCQDLGVTVVVFSDNDHYDKSVVPAIINQGVRGYILKNDPVSLELADIIRKIRQDKTYAYYSPEVQALLAVE